MFGWLGENRRCPQTWTTRLLNILSDRGSELERLPLVPRDILRRFHVDEVCDSRFAASARLLQSIWREQQGLEIGRHCNATTGC